VDRASDSDSESQGFDSLHAYGLNSSKSNTFGTALVSTFKISECMTQVEVCILRKNIQN